MNTLFKFYNGIWILLALASAALVAWMIQGAGDEDDRPRWTIRRSTLVPGLASTASTPIIAGTMGRQDETSAQFPDASPIEEESRFPAHAVRPSLHTRQWAQVGLFVSVIAIAASLVYPLVATGARLGQQFAQPGRSWTLNALDWMDYGQVREMGPGDVVFAYDEDRDIIEWFNDEVDGSPVIAEASIGPYRCGGTRISIHTGLPVVVGWPWHESQQRGWADLRLREADLRTLYASTNPQEKLAILERYRVEYVVIGELERSYPSARCESTDNAAGIAAFEPLVGGRLEVAYTSGDSIVYRVVAP